MGVGQEAGGGEAGIWPLGAHPASIMNEVRGRYSVCSGRSAASARPMWRTSAQRSQLCPSAHVSVHCDSSADLAV